MTADGAHLGVSAERAIETILGGKPSPSADEQMDADTFRTWIKTCPDNVTGYGETARLAARYMLDYLTAHPEDMQLPLDREIDWERLQAEHGDAYPEGWYDTYQKTPGLYDRMKVAGWPIDDLDLTGFMAGWAFNAARRCLEVPPAPNPALRTIGKTREAHP